jgi:hypothetical protein
MIPVADITPDYAYYTTAYHGKMNEDTFTASLSDAVYEVESRIWDKADISPYLDRCKMAVCAIAEAVGNSSSRLRSFTSGKTSESYDAPPFSMSAEAAVKRYLGNTGILRGGKWL